MVQVGEGMEERVDWEGPEYTGLEDWCSGELKVGLMM